MSRDDFQRQADLVRAIPLKVVLTSWGVTRDRHDKSRWRTARGPLSVTGTKFFNWHTCQGGGGAIDLVMHLSGWNARQAIEWLGHYLGGDSSYRGLLANQSDENPTRRVRHQQLRLPTSSRVNLPRVRRYLTLQRGLSETILASLINEGKLYADARGNAVFLMVTGRPNRPIGAELRGTGHRLWRGLAPGTCKNAGYFWVGNRGSKQIILCESAIDAISCFQLRAQLHDPRLRVECICISTAGVRSNPPWLRPLLARRYNIYCGFDADEPGESASRQMITHHPSIRRLKPPQHDWNDVLTAHRH